jgi:hypothetical protein
MARGYEECPSVVKSCVQRSLQRIFVYDGEGATKEALRGGHVSGGTEQGVDQIARAINGAVQVRTTCLSPLSKLHPRTTGSLLYLGAAGATVRPAEGQSAPPNPAVARYLNRIFRTFGAAEGQSLFVLNTTTSAVPMVISVF